MTRQIADCLNSSALYFSMLSIFHLNTIEHFSLGKIDIMLNKTYLNNTQFDAGINAREKEEHDRSGRSV